MGTPEQPPERGSGEITIRIGRAQLAGLVGLLLGAALGFGAAHAFDDDAARTVLYGAPPAGQTAAASPGAPVKVATADRPARGPARAKVTVVEFVDFQCPFCGRYARDTLPQIEREYGDRIRYVSRQFPLTSIHPHAMHAALAAECAAEQGRYWEYHHALFARQQLGPRSLVRQARAVGVDTKRFDDCRRSPATRNRVERDVADGRRYGVTGTPTLFINGQPLKGAQPFAAVKAAIDADLH
jgi:protein-disulfide isomerase